MAFLSQLYGKGEVTAQKLRSGGYITAERLRDITPEKLANVAGLSVSSSKSMINEVREMLQQNKKEGKNRLVAVEGIGYGRAKKLWLAGLDTVEAVAGVEEETLARVLKVPKSVARKMISSAQQLSGSVPSAGVIHGETEALTTQVLPKERRRKEESRLTRDRIKSFWKFG